MKKHQSQTNQAFSSLVLNPPYRIDSFSTSPKIAKILDFPFGIRLDIPTILRFIHKLTMSMALFMTISCISIFCFYLPLDKQNTKLFNEAKSLTSEKYSLLVNLHEASTYNKLYSNVDNYSLKDTKEIIHVESNVENPAKKETTLITFNKYPSVQFAGF